jgi:hypothetical protein
VIQHPVWPYLRFTPSYRDIENCLHRGRTVAAHLGCLRRSETVAAAGLADEAMAEQLTDPRIRSYVVSRFLSRLSRMAIAGKLIRLRDGYNVRWKLV